MLIPALPYFLYAFLSSNSAYSTLGLQYSAMLVPMVYTSTIISSLVIANRFLKRLRIPGQRKLPIVVFAVMCVVLLSGCSLSFSVDPIAPDAFYHPAGIFPMYRTPDIGTSTTAVVYLSEHINKSATILTQNNLFPFFSTFIHSYSTPWSPGVNFSTADNFQYIVGDYGNGWVYSSYGNEPSISATIQKDLTNGTYGVYAEGGTVIAIKKHYSGSPVFYSPLSKSYTPERLNIDYGTIQSNGTLQVTNAVHSFMWNGPYVTFLPGLYSMVFELGIQNLSKGNLTIDVTSAGGMNMLFTKTFYGNATSVNGEGFFSVTANVTATLPLTDVEFRGYGNFTGTVYLKEIMVNQLSW